MEFQTVRRIVGGAYQLNPCLADHRARAISSFPDNGVGLLINLRGVFFCQGFGDIKIDCKFHLSPMVYRASAERFQHLGKGANFSFQHGAAGDQFF